MKTLIIWGFSLTLFYSNLVAQTREEFDNNRILFFQKCILANLSDSKLEKLLPDTDDVNDMNIHPLGSETKLEGMEWKEKASYDYKLNSLSYLKLGSLRTSIKDGNLIWPGTTHTWINCSNYFVLEITEIRNVILIKLIQKKGHVIFKQRCNF